MLGRENPVPIRPSQKEVSAVVGGRPRRSRYDLSTNRLLWLWAGGGSVVVVVGGGVGGRRLHAAEAVGQLVRFDEPVGVAPAAGVDSGHHPGDVGPSIVRVVLAGPVVVVDLGDAAVDVGVHPHQVLPVSAAQAL